MSLISLKKYKTLASALLTGSLLSACATMDSGLSAQVQERPQEKINTLEITTPIDKNPIYQLMIAEMAVNTGNTDLAVDQYLTLALTQDDPKIAERAVRIAVYGSDLNAAQMAAERWIELEPARGQPGRVFSQSLTRLGMVSCW